MSPIQAQQKLEAALDRLEAAARRLKEQAAAGGAPQGDQQQLSADLEKMRNDYAALEQVTETATDRLDAAIARLKTALED
jgi:seryl-tRNA synthetase